MQGLVPEGNWAMAAVIGMKDEEVEKVGMTIKERMEA